MTKSTMAHTLSVNAQCPLPPATAVTEISGGTCCCHHLLQLRRVASVVSRALVGVAIRPLVPGVLTPIFPSYATRALVMPVGCMVSTSPWRCSVMTRTSSRLVRASRITSLTSWTTLLLHLGSGGATRQTNVPIVFTRRTTPCRRSSCPWGGPNNPLLNLRVWALLLSIVHPPLSRFQGEGAGHCAPIINNVSSGRNTPYIILVLPTGPHAITEGLVPHLIHPSSP